MRTALIAILIATSLSAHAALVLDQTGQLDANSPELPTGERYQTFTIPVREQDVVVCACEAEGFGPYLIATVGERVFEGPSGEVTFVALQAGEATVIVTSAEAGEMGAFRLTVDLLPLKGDPDAPVVGKDSLAEGDLVLESGEFADTYEFPVEAGRAYIVFVAASARAPFDAYIVVARPGAEPVDVDDTDGTDPEFTWISDRDGSATLLVTSAKPGETGEYDLAVLAGDLDYLAPAPVSAPAAAPVAPTVPYTPDAPVEASGAPDLPPAPELTGSAPLDLSAPEWVVPAPEPSGDVSELLARGLHRMNYVEVELQGRMDCFETNPRYQREWPTGFGWEIDNYLQGGAGGPPLKCPLQWTGDIFTAYGLQPDGAGGHVEMVNVTGRVSAGGDRILWVSVRSFEQGVYEDRDTDERFASYQCWKALALVDLPLNNPHWEAYGDERLTTMADLMTRMDETLILRDGFSYGWTNHANAGDHVLEAGYLLREPGPGDSYLVPDDLHLLSYRSTEWQNAQAPPTARLRFEYNAKLDR